MTLIVSKLNKIGLIEPSKIFQEKVTLIKKKFNTSLENLKLNEGKLVPINKALIEKLSQWKMKREDYNKKLEEKMTESEVMRQC